MSVSYLLELLDGTLVDTAALVDQVTSGGGLTGVDVANDHKGNVHFIFRHFRVEIRFYEITLEQIIYD